MGSVLLAGILLKVGLKVCLTACSIVLFTTGDILVFYSFFENHLLVQNDFDYLRGLRR